MIRRPIPCSIPLCWLTMVTNIHYLIGSCEAFSRLNPPQCFSVNRQLQNHRRQKAQVLKSTESNESMLENQFETLIKAATIDAVGRVLGGDFAGLAATFSPGKSVFRMLDFKVVAYWWGSTFGYPYKIYPYQTFQQVRELLSKSPIT